VKSSQASTSVMAITKCLILAQTVNRFTGTARALRQRGRTSDWMVRAGLETWVMRTNANRENRELSVQELETVSGGETKEQVEKQQENKKQMEAFKAFAQVLQGQI
jgi:DNA-binding transcriptional regulator of glucitol operon